MRSYVSDRVFDGIRPLSPAAVAQLRNRYLHMSGFSELARQRQALSEIPGPLEVAVADDVAPAPAAEPVVPEAPQAPEAAPEAPKA
jgi:hypothetical protein